MPPIARPETSIVLAFDLHGTAVVETYRMTRTFCSALTLATVATCLVGAAAPAGDYPMSLTAQATATAGAATVTSAVTIHVDRLMEESRKKTVSDRLRFEGYAKFVPALRALPPVGTIEVQARSVNIRYADEQTGAAGRRLVLIADRPLFFLGGDPAKNKAGYELTIVELRFDAAGGVTGTMAGAARVKTSPNGPILDDFSEAPVGLTAKLPPR
jgi:hypothetical protein